MQERGQLFLQWQRRQGWRACLLPMLMTAQAKSLFKAMSDYLATQQAISFAYDSTVAAVTEKEQKLGLASSGTLTLNRPDKLHATRTGGFANVEMSMTGRR